MKISLDLPHISNCDGNVPFSSNLGTGTAQCSPLDVSGTRRFKYFTSPEFEYGNRYTQLPHHSAIASMDEELSSTPQIEERLDNGEDSDVDRTKWKVPVHFATYCNSGTQTTNDSSSSGVMDKEIQVTNNDNDDQPNEQWIEFKLEKKQWEEDRETRVSALPPVTDEKSLRKYRTFVEESEKKEYALKEKELDCIMNQKLEKFQRNLFKRYSQSDLLVEERIEAIRSSKVAAFDTEYSNSKNKRNNSKVTKQGHTGQDLELASCDNTERRLLDKNITLPNFSQSYNARTSLRQLPAVTTSKSRKVQNHIRDLELINAIFEEDKNPHKVCTHQYK